MSNAPSLKDRLHNAGKIRELEQQVQLGAVETVIAAFTDNYGRLMGKRFDAEFFLENIANSGTHACNYLLTVDMEMEPTPGYKFANWELGYGDLHLVPDLNTLKILSWQEKTAFVHCDIPASVAPRSILQKQLQNAKEVGFEALGASLGELFRLACLARIDTGRKLLAGRIALHAGRFQTHGRIDTER